MENKFISCPLLLAIGPVVCLLPPTPHLLRCITLATGSWLPCPAAWHVIQLFNFEVVRPAEGHWPTGLSQGRASCQRLGSGDATGHLRKVYKTGRAEPCAALRLKELTSTRAEAPRGSVTGPGSGEVVTASLTEFRGQVG